MVKITRIIKVKEKGKSIGLSLDHANLLSRILIGTIIGSVKLYNASYNLLIISLSISLNHDKIARPKNISLSADNIKWTKLRIMIKSANSESSLKAYDTSPAKTGEVFESGV